ncbi:MAG TPA: SDR family NAD(P)-dependent oxidoreductase [Acidimicrobiales bacterium]|nr:SDR family NAD(P)-dependent oxidoreductase [Acidimicrobiales bacterium]
MIRVVDRFTDKSCLVTGAGSGMGRAIALRLAAEGGRVTASDVSSAGLEEVAARAREEGWADRLHTTVLDVSDEAAVDSVVGEVIARQGGLDALVNAAGILRAVHTEECSTELWDRVLRVNLTGTFLVIRAALPALLAAKGAILNFSSTAASFGHPYMAAYAASKGGVSALTQTLAAEYAKAGLRVVAVAPGGISTPMVDALELPPDADMKNIMRLMPLNGHFGSPEDLAGLAATLLSEEGRHVTGITVRVDAGTHC